MHLQFKLVFSEKKSTKWNKLMKYRKNQSKCAKFEYVVPGTVVGLPKKIGGQNKKKFAECQSVALGKLNYLSSA